MKKKLLLVIALVAVITTSVLVFAACGSAPTQGQLSDIFCSNEHYEYKVTQVLDNENPDVKKEGTYTVDIKSYEKGSSIPFGNKTLENVPQGYLISGDLAINGDVIKTLGYFKMVERMKYVSSYATYRYSEINGETFQMDGMYDGATLNYTKIINGGDKITGSLTSNEPFYDNNILHQLLRSISTYSAQMQFAFNIPLIANGEDAVAGVSLIVGGAKKIITPYSNTLAASSEDYKDGINCYACALNRTAAVNGMFQEYYVAIDPIKINGWNLTHVICKIVEPTNINKKPGSVTYELTNISIPTIG